MKILKEGNLSNLTSVAFECPRCGCVFDATIGECDLEFDAHHNVRYYCHCPTCGELLASNVVARNKQ